MLRFTPKLFFTQVYQKKDQENMHFLLIPCSKYSLQQVKSRLLSPAIFPEKKTLFIASHN